MKNDKTYIFSLSEPQQVLECIEKWRKLDLRKMTDYEVDRELRSFIGSLGEYTLSRADKFFFRLWRIRKAEYFFKSEAECWEPPKDETPMGRCNALNDPLLYVSEKLKTPFEELMVKPGKQVYLIKYKQIKHLNLRKIITDELRPTDLHGKPIFDESSLISYQILREFVRSEFLKPIGIGTEYLHRISASMCRVWFDEDDLDGWLYPSIQSPNDMNIAIKPKAAREKLEIEEIRIVRMVDKESVKNSGKIAEKSMPLFNMMQMVIQSDFKGEINDGAIYWQPSDDIGGDF